MQMYMVTHLTYHVNLVKDTSTNQEIQMSEIGDNNNSENCEDDDKEPAKDGSEDELSEDFDCFCKVCQMAFTSDSVLSQHIREIHETI